VPHATKDRGSFWWKDLLRLCDVYRGIARCTVGDGSTVLFWSDIWNGHLLQDKFPRLSSFAKDKLFSVAMFLSTTQMGKLFHLPLFSEAWQEYQALQAIIQGRGIKIAGLTFGENLSTHLQSITIYTSVAYNPQSHLSGYGILSVQTNSESLDGYS
jgi:hypothetical protein